MLTCLGLNKPGEALALGSEIWALGSKILIVAPSSALSLWPLSPLETDSLGWLTPLLVLYIVTSMVTPWLVLWLGQPH